jgi:hypothetical protein
MHMLNGKKRKGKDQLRRLQESKIVPNVFVVVPLHDDHPHCGFECSNGLHTLQAFSNSWAILLFLLVPPAFSWVLLSQFGPFLLAPTQEYCPPFGRLDGSAKFFHSLIKWPKEYDKILAFIHEVSSREIYFCFPFNLMHLLSFNFYIYLIMCKSIIPRTKFILFLPTFLGTFLFLWRGWLVHERKA